MEDKTPLIPSPNLVPLIPSYTQQESSNQMSNTNQQQQQYYQTQSLSTQPTQPTVVQQAIQLIDINWVNPSNIIVKEPIIIVLLSFFVFPGIGHLLIGQHTKGLYLLVIGFILAFVNIIPLLGQVIFLIFLVIVGLDAFQMAKRVQMGYPIMHGECANEYVEMILSPLMKPMHVFVHPNGPEEWKRVIERIERPNNL